VFETPVAIALVPPDTRKPSPRPAGGSHCLGYHQAAAAGSADTGNVGYWILALFPLMSAIIAVAGYCRCFWFLVLLDIAGVVADADVPLLSRGAT
jgi:hypothetical protein